MNVLLVIITVSKSVSTLKGLSCVNAEWAMNWSTQLTAQVNILFPTSTAL